MSTRKPANLGNDSNFLKSIEGFVCLSVIDCQLSLCTPVSNFSPCPKASSIKVEKFYFIR